MIKYLYKMMDGTKSV